MNEWKPIETAPEVGAFLVWMPEPHIRSHMAVASWHPNLKVVGGCFLFDLRSKPTHWMPLPEPPKP